MPPIAVTAAGAHRDHRTLDVPEPQVLEEFEEGPFRGEHRLLLVECGLGKWILATPQLDVYLEDLQDEDMSVVPLGRI